MALHPKGIFMQHVSFKKFSAFVDLPEDATPEQLQEIFGIFPNIEKLQAQKAKLKSAEFAKRKEIAQQKDKIRADRAAQISDKTKQKLNALDTLDPAQMRAGHRRAIDRDPFGMNS